MSLHTQRLDVATTKFLLADAQQVRVRGRVLDAGCGSKPYKPFFPDCEWVGVDARPVGDVHADLHTLEYKDEFDTVICTNTLHECAEPFVVVKRLADALKEGGTLLLTAPRTMPEDGETFWLFPPQGLALLCQAVGLKPVELKTEGGLMRSEFDSWVASLQASPMMPTEFDGYLDELNRDYPIMSAVIATK